MIFSYFILFLKEATRVYFVFLSWVFIIFREISVNLSFGGTSVDAVNYKYSAAARY